MPCQAAIRQTLRMRQSLRVRESVRESRASHDSHESQMGRVSRQDSRKSEAGTGRHGRGQFTPGRGSDGSGTCEKRCCNHFTQAATAGWQNTIVQSWQRKIHPFCHGRFFQYFSVQTWDILRQSTICGVALSRLQDEDGLLYLSDL